MNAIELLRQESQLAFSDFIEVLDGVSEPESWAVLPPAGEHYLHSDGSIHGLVLHVATCKFMYGSIAFRNSEIRWRDTAEQVEKFEPSWPAALDYLNESHRYWMEAWSSLKEGDLETEVPHFSGKTWPAWKIIRMIIYHDAYHGGQIPVLRYASKASNLPPPSVAEDIRKYCMELPSW